MLAGLLGQSHAMAEQIQSQILQGFTASAALVNDPQWEEKWSQSEPVVPQFDLAQAVRHEQPATLLIFFSNPQIKDESIWVSCDLEIRDARNALVGKLIPEICFTRTPAEGPADVYLFPSMELTAAHTTISGLMTVTVGITDENRGQRIELMLDILVDKSS
jgi:hypothetical protein